MNFYKDYSFLGCSLGDVQVFLKKISLNVGTHLPKYTASSPEDRHLHSHLCENYIPLKHL
jgi:hypothetical protein